ncbi:MAG: type II CAAX prenyl endopeptidase Rce1 family protein [Lysobacterales bacterium]
MVGIQSIGSPWHHAPDTATAFGSAWRGALASFYGGIVEEIECRLLLVSLFVWLLAWLNGQQARPWMFVVAIVLAALLFGAGHLPAAFAIGVAHTPLAIARIVPLNALVGLIAGGLFWKYGLEHAMLAHFCADLVLHVAVPLAAQL